MKHITEIVQDVKGRETKPLTAGLKFLDEIMGGLYPGEMTVICGDTNCGKTTLMIRQIHKLVVDQKIPVLMVLCSMDEKTFLACMAAYYCNIITEDVRKALTSEYCAADFKDYKTLLQESPIYIMEGREFDMQHPEKLYEFVVEKNIQAIFIEEFGLLYETDSDQKKTILFLKELAQGQKLAIVIEYRFWTNDRYPALSFRQFDSYDMVVFADNIIGMVDCDNQNIQEDEKGQSMRGILEIKIMKHKGEWARGKSIKFSRMLFLVRDPHRATYVANDRQGFVLGPEISRLVKSEFDCELVDAFIPE